MHPWYIRPRSMLLTLTMNRRFWSSEQYFSCHTLVNTNSNEEIVYTTSCILEGRRIDERKTASEGLLHHEGRDIVGKLTHHTI